MSELGLGGGGTWTVLAVCTKVNCGEDILRTWCTLRARVGVNMMSLLLYIEVCFVITYIFRLKTGMVNERQDTSSEGDIRMR